MSSKNLVIVESPAKAKTIGKFLGKDFKVKSSFGHIRDLPKKGLNIEIDNDFKPVYEIPVDKKNIVSELKTDARGAETVWLASDEDREGEAIAWHLKESLKLSDKQTRRIVFHEITEKAIKEAIDNPRGIDIDLVNAQQARRVLDRLVGYELSPILWKKVQPKLSAGRVQSVAVRLIVEREREIRNFKPEISYKVTATFLINKESFTADLSQRLNDEDSVQEFLKSCINSRFEVADIAEKPSERNPSAPFTTSTLQQEASRKLGYSVKQTMTLAQRLYENGHITYMRTDSTNLSSFALTATEDFIKKEYGANYHHYRQFQTKSSTAQEAHEAIRPTNIRVQTAGQDSGQQKLYQLIWRRMVASQMAPAKILKTEIKISIGSQPLFFLAKGEVLNFDGFLKVYGGGKDDAILPKLNIGDKLQLDSLIAHQSFSRPPARYSEASLVKTLEELGIGRPSTYAPTISTIQSRGYIEKVDLLGEERQVINYSLINKQIIRETAGETYGADKNKLLPTHLAEVTTDFLTKYFESIIDPGFTAEVERQLDNIAEGRQVWQQSIKDFYENFHPLISKASTVSRQETSQARLLGKDPATKEPIYARFGKYGPMLQKGEVDDDKKPVFAPMPGGTRIEDVTLDQAIKMFSLPRTVGKTEDGKPITANIGRFGPYIKVDKLFVSIKPLDPFTIDEMQARQFYKDKLAISAKREIKSFSGSKIKILKGPYGPYVTDGSKNARIPKAIDPQSIELEQAKEMLAKSKPSRKRNIKRG